MYVTQTVPVEIKVIITAKPTSTKTPDPLSDIYRNEPPPTIVQRDYDYPVPEPYTLIDAKGSNNWSSEVLDWIACDNAAFWWEMTGSSLILRITNIGKNNTQVLQYIDITPPEGTFIIELDGSTYQIEIFTTGDWELDASCEPFLH